MGNKNTKTVAAPNAAHEKENHKTTINLYPTTCNICNGNVKLVSNKSIYGREYGSGKCYLCTDCWAYVGTHKPRPTEALGLLADAEMRDLKKKCHSLFDPLWMGAQEKNRRAVRSMRYGWLARKLGIDREICHFGYFDTAMLKRALNALAQKAQTKTEGGQK